MKIVVGGQIDKQKVYDTIKGVVGDRASVEIKDDIAAAMAVKTGQADYYFGACKTGGGGALAMAIALCGYGQCVTLASPGKTMTPAEIAAQVQSGKTCFGFVPESISTVVPPLMAALLEKKG